ncbi:MAG: hypothetical protein CSA95_04315 [Bacteroidetes bacterium]|nr:MAG: hypothetical protein CSA95_04315 [Bacteroidota bacterium]
MAEEVDKIQNSSTGERLKFLLKDSVIYGGVSSISKFLHIFLLPILTELVSKEDYGIYDTLLTISAFILVVVISGTDTSVARFFYDTKSFEKQKRIVSEVLFFELFMSLLLCAILFVVSEWLLNLYFGNVDNLHEMYWLIATIPFIAMVRYTQNLLKWVYKRLQFIIISVGSITLNILLAILLMLYVGADIKYLFFAQFISMLLFTILGLFFAREYFVIPRNFNTIISQLKFGLPLSVNQFITSFIPNIERYFISSFLGVGMLGVYGVGNKISQLSQMAINGFQVAWGPLSFSIINEDNSEDTYSKVYDYYMIFSSFFVVVFAYLIPVFINILATNDYKEATFVILLLMLSKMIMSITGITGIGLSIAKKTEYYIFSSLVRLVIIVFFLFTLIPYMGINGVAMASLIGSVVFSIFLNWFSYKKTQIRFRFIEGGGLFVVSALVSALLLVCDSWWVKTLILCGFSLSAVVYSVFVLFQKDDRLFWLKLLKIRKS